MLLRIASLVLIVISTYGPAFAKYEDAIRKIAAPFIGQLSNRQYWDMQLIMGKKVNNSNDFYVKTFIDEFSLYNLTKDSTHEIMSGLNQRNAALKDVFEKYRKKAGKKFKETQGKYSDIKTVVRRAYKQVAEDYKKAAAPFYNLYAYDHSLKDFEPDAIPSLMLDIMGQGSLTLVKHEKQTSGTKYEKTIKSEGHKDLAHNYMSYICYIFGVMCASAIEDDQHKQYIEKWFNLLTKPESLTEQAFNVHKATAKHYVLEGVEFYDSIYRDANSKINPKDITSDPVSKYFYPGSFVDNLVFFAHDPERPNDIRGPYTRLLKVANLLYSGKDNKFLEWIKNSEPKAIELDEAPDVTDYSLTILMTEPTKNAAKSSVSEPRNPKREEGKSTPAEKQLKKDKKDRIEKQKQKEKDKQNRIEKQKQKETEEMVEAEEIEESSDISQQTSSPPIPTEGFIPPPIPSAKSTATPLPKGSIFGDLTSITLKHVKKEIAKERHLSPVEQAFLDSEAFEAISNYKQRIKDLDDASDDETSDDEWDDDDTIKAQEEDNDTVTAQAKPKNKTKTARTSSQKRPLVAKKKLPPKEIDKEKLAQEAKEREEAANELRSRLLQIRSAFENEEDSSSDDSDDSELSDWEK